MLARASLRQANLLHSRLKVPVRFSHGDYYVCRLLCYWTLTDRVVSPAPPVRNAWE
jgi:hypothetical protein